MEGGDAYDLKISRNHYWSKKWLWSGCIIWNHRLASRWKRRDRSKNHWKLYWFFRTKQSIIQMGIVWGVSVDTWHPDSLELWIMPSSAFLSNKGVVRWRLSLFPLNSRDIIFSYGYVHLFTSSWKQGRKGELLRYFPEPYFCLQLQESWPCIYL